MVTQIGKSLMKRGIQLISKIEKLSQIDEDIETIADWILDQEYIKDEIEWLLQQRYLDSKGKCSYKIRDDYDGVFKNIL